MSSFKNPVSFCAHEFTSYPRFRMSKIPSTHIVEINTSATEAQTLFQEQYGMVLQPDLDILQDEDPENGLANEEKLCK